MAKKSTNWSNLIKFTDFPLFPLFGVPGVAVRFKLASAVATVKCLDVPLASTSYFSGVRKSEALGGVSWGSPQNRRARGRAGFALEIGRNVIFLPVPWLVSAAVV